MERAWWREEVRVVWVSVSESTEVKNEVVGVLLARGLTVIFCWCEGRRASDEYVAVGLLGLRRGVFVVVVLVFDNRYLVFEASHLIGLLFMCQLERRREF